MLPILPPMKSLLATRNHNFATCWIIERKDGTILRFTDHDAPLTVDGNFFHTAGASPSARQKLSQLDPPNLDFIGIIDSDFITLEDLRAGLFREAKVTEVVVDHRYPWAGKFSVTEYWVDSVNFTGVRWEAKLSGLTRFLQPEIGRVYGRMCPYVLGDAKCSKNLTAFTFSGTIGTLGNVRKVFTDSALGSHGLNYFANGTVEFTSGANDGVKAEVRESTVGGQLTLYLPLPFNLQVGDTFTAVAGDDHTAGTCKNKFNNLVNFGGFPFVPGNDAMLQYPNVKGG